MILIVVQHQAFAAAASQKGLEVEQVRGPDPRLLEEGADLSAAQIPLHFLFRSTYGHIIQVIDLSSSKSSHRNPFLSI